MPPRYLQDRPERLDLRLGCNGALTFAAYRLRSSAASSHRLRDASLCRDWQRTASTSPHHLVALQD